LQELRDRGHQDIELEQLIQDIQRRDEQDSNRSIAPLQKATDAIEIVTDGLTVEQVTAKIMELYA
jgi:pantoate ligase/cytidylate kinase